MNKLLPIDIRAVRKVACVMAAILLAVGGLPLLFNGNVAAVQLGSRSIQLSDSGNSGGTIVSGVGSGTNVSYKVTFTTGATSGTPTPW